MVTQALFEGALRTIVLPAELSTTFKSLACGCLGGSSKGPPGKRKADLEKVNSGAEESPVPGAGRPGGDPFLGVGERGPRLRSRRPRARGLLPARPRWREVRSGSGGLRVRSQARGGRAGGPRAAGSPFEDPGPTAGGAAPGACAGARAPGSASDPASPGAAAAAGRAGGSGCRGR